MINSRRLCMRDNREEMIGNPMVQRAYLGTTHIR